jgi:hypothetical protein
MCLKLRVCISLLLILLQLLASSFLGDAPPKQSRFPHTPSRGIHLGYLACFSYLRGFGHQDVRMAPPWAQRATMDTKKRVLNGKIIITVVEFDRGGDFLFLDAKSPPPDTSKTRTSRLGFFLKNPVLGVAETSFSSSSKWHLAPFSAYSLPHMYSHEIYKWGTQKLQHRCNLETGPCSSYGSLCLLGYSHSNDVPYCAENGGKFSAWYWSNTQKHPNRDKAFSLPILYKSIILNVFFFSS